jgi:hypothetical protein
VASRNRPIAYDQPEPQGVPRDYAARQRWRHDVERQRLQEVVTLADNVDGLVPNLLTDGVYYGQAVTLPGPATRARLALSCDDIDAKAWLQREWEAGWSDLYSLTPGVERGIEVPTQARVRVHIDAVATATCTGYRLDLRRAQ